MSIAMAWAIVSATIMASVMLAIVITAIAAPCAMFGSQLALLALGVNETRRKSLEVFGEVIRPIFVVTTFYFVLGFIFLVDRVPVGLFWLGALLIILGITVRELNKVAHYT